MSWRDSLESIESKCDGGDHDKYCTPCNVFECADCNGSLCQKSSLPVQWAVMSTGFVCAACADSYEDEPEVSADGMAVSYWKKPVIFDEARYNSARVALALGKDVSIYDVLAKYRGAPFEIGIEY